jgi:hypothetical protein
MLLGVVSNLLGGVTTDWLSARLGLRIGRMSIGIASYVAAAGMMLLAAIESDGQRRREMLGACGDVACQ